jgi:hypothetical protein
MEKFVARQNVAHYRRQLEHGVDGARRATLLRLLIEELTCLGFTNEQLGNLDRHIARLGKIMARQVELIGRLQLAGESVEQPELILATLNDVMVAYLAHRQKINAALGSSPN